MRSFIIAVVEQPAEISARIQLFYNSSNETVHSFIIAAVE